jgi:hypothetical protein
MPWFIGFLTLKTQVVLLRGVSKVRNISLRPPEPLWPQRSRVATVSYHQGHFVKIAE